MIFSIVLPIIILDQLAKFIISKKLLLGQSYPVLENIFHLTLVHNRGAAFGILKNQVPFFILTSLFAIILVFFNLKKYKINCLYSISLCLILAGAFGNLIDRVLLGYVVDFLDFRVWPVFNIADTSISMGALLLGVSILKESRSKA